MQPQEIKLSAKQTVSIHPAASIGTATLKVADLQRSLSFYQGMLGLKIFRQDERRAILGAGKQPILNLEELPGAQRQPAHTTGLYHVAILFPDRRSLAIKIAQLSTQSIRFGQSDHLVSEAFYLSDPDGNGLELYRDRPRNEWQWDNQRVRMAVDPIDFDNFFAGITESEVASAPTAAPDGTRLGHIHLRVADITPAEQFYHGELGLDVTARMPGALFLSAGGYHHHLGMNTWESRGGKPPAEPCVGLREFSIVLPDQKEIESLVKRIETAGLAVEYNGGTAVLRDPFQNQIRLVSS